MLRKKKQNSLDEPNPTGNVTNCLNRLNNYQSHVKLLLYGDNLLGTNLPEVPETVSGQATNITTPTKDIL